MRGLCCALTALLFSSCLVLPAATRIDDPKSFVTEVYGHYVASQTRGKSYSAPEDIYTARLAKLIRDDRKKAKGEVGCLDFDFWVNGQDWEITKPVITSVDQGPDRKTVVAKFRNLGDPQEIHLDFVRNGGRWLLDEVHSKSATPWTLSQVLKCAP